METIETVEAEVVSESGKFAREQQARRDRKAEITREVLDSIIGVVNVDDDEVDEYRVIGDVLVRGGFMWRCINSRCSGLNHTNCATCDNCGKRRPKQRDVPEVEDMTGLSLEYRRVELKKLRKQQEESREQQQYGEQQQCLDHQG